MKRRGVWLFASLAVLGCAASPEQLDRPTNVAFGLDGDVYVADGYNHARIARFSAGGELLSEWGEKGFGRGQFDTPHGIATDDEGRVYVADRENARVQVFSADGGYLAQWKSAALGRPWAIAFGPDRHVYVVDGGDQDPERPRGHVLRIDLDGEIVDRWGTSGDGPGEIDWGHGIAVGQDGSVYVTSLRGRGVQKFRRTK
ncbi:MULTISPECIES: SMP-30/gluconolactonase/LRE family protein [Sorangium]|uniref:SMP-30/gluconolactonase/LRE family protein n=1 Tax=Sorangium TaxID=39643 RepID=UPI00101A3336|nr:MULTISPECIES: SMP-30/gluconolactonase/LRE family protein [Sorangium]